LKDALADYTRALALDPKFADAYNNRGVIYVTQNRPDLAQADYDSALQLKPGSANIYLNRGLTKLVQGRTKEAQEDFDQCLALDQKLKLILQQRIELAKKLLSPGP